MTVIETQTKPHADRELTDLEALWVAPAAERRVRRTRNLTTEHHAGGWAAYEIGAFSALALASAAGLAARRR